MCEAVGSCDKYLLRCKKELQSRKLKDGQGDFEALNPEVVLISDGILI